MGQETYFAVVAGVFVAEDEAGTVQGRGDEGRG
jgi:hypothetical protein